MAAVKPPKKSETIEVRLSHEAKAAFMERCRHEQLTASEAIRLFIDDQLETRAKPRRRRTAGWRIVAAGIAGAVLGLGAAAPSFAWAAQNTRPAFDRLDHNHDGVLSYQEFRSR
jgi:ferric-dicitrate binding protein FerR (iron transport regulator)